MLLLPTVGCSTLPVPNLKLPRLSMGPLGGNEQPYFFVGQGAGPASASLSEAAYRKVQQAKAENAIVLQIVGDDVPLRVLPLPPASGQATTTSVFVSTLIEQTEIAKQVGAINAGLYRVAPGSINGVRMDVQFTGDGEVRPETDYALRAGDRLVVSKKEPLGLEALVDMAMDR
ncbi:MAG: hypothetical protein AAGJ40_11190 [Planctomycetota bacterium]